jgi:hypothetical protein
VFVRVGIPPGTPASRVEVQSAVQRLDVRLLPEKTKAKWYGVGTDGTLRVTDSNVTLEGGPSGDARATEKVGGDLTRPVVAGETIWTIDRAARSSQNARGAHRVSDDSDPTTCDCVSIVLTKASRWLSSLAWSALFVGDPEKSLAALAKELHDADEPSPRHCDLPEAAQIAVEDTRERRVMMGTGQWKPDDPVFDDFRVVLSNEETETE